MEINNVEIIKIGEVKTYGESGFRKCEFIVKDSNSQYPQEIQFSITQDNAENFVKYNKVGEMVDIKFNLNGRSWLKDGEPEEKRRWFNDLVAWRVEKVKGDVPAPVEPSEAFEPSNEGDDLPF